MKMLSTEVGSAELARLLGVTPRAVTDLKGTHKLEPSVNGYCEYLRTMASGRGGEAGVLARERLGQAQATLAEAKAGQLRGELVEESEVEAFWRSKLKAFRNRVLAVPSRVRDLTARQDVMLTQELRAALTELADDAT
jgi:phage terminase Nu1 subunit (DNA packaging protein)